MAKKKNKKPQPQAPISPEKYLREKVRSLPIGKCYLNPNWADGGMAQVVVTRPRPNGNVVVGLFLVDTYCLGVKDVMYSVNMDPEDLDEMLKNIKGDIGLEETSYNEAHNLIYGAVGFAEDAGIEPAKDFRFARYVLEEDTDDIPLIEYEYGRNGRHCLVVNPDRKEMPYIHILKRNLGDDFDYILPYDDWYDEFVDEDDEHLEDEPYGYQHPDYPEMLEVKDEFLVEELYDPDNYFALPEATISRILALPHEQLVHDLTAIIYYEIGRTCQAIANGTIEDPTDGALMHAVLLLGQLGRAEATDALLEILRQDQGFLDYHFGDQAPEQIIPALALSAESDLTPLVKYLYEPGMISYARSSAAEALAMILWNHPERREEIMEIYRELLKSMVERLPEKKGCDSHFASSVIDDLAGLRASELLPEIKAVYDTGFVDEFMAGDYTEVESELRKAEMPEKPWYYVRPDIRRQYEKVLKDSGLSH